MIDSICSFSSVSINSDADFDFGLGFRLILLVQKHVVLEALVRVFLPLVESDWEITTSDLSRLLKGLLLVAHLAFRAF